MSVSFRTALLSLTVGLLLVTVLAIGALSLVNTQRSVDGLSAALRERISREAVAKLQALLAPAQVALLEHRTQAERNLLPVHDQLALSDRLAERLRHEPTLTWLSFGDEHGRFTGAWRRQEDGAIIANRSSIGADGRGRLIEEEVRPDGSREPVRTSADWHYDPRLRPFYALGAARPGVVWTPPYEWWDRKGLGITAALAHRPGGRLAGVFTADLHLHELSSFLDRLAPGRSGRVYIVTRAGEVIAGPTAVAVGPAASVDPVLGAALVERGDQVWRQRADRPLVFEFRHRGREYGVGIQPLGMGEGIEWAALTYVPADELLGFVQDNLRWTLWIGGSAVALAVVLATVLSLRVTRRLGDLAGELEAVGRFELDTRPASPSRIREVRMVADAAERMKIGLRSFGHYVPTPLVRELVVSGEEATLGVERRTLTVFFSDVEGFSRLCMEIPPDRLVRILSSYFTMIGDIVGRHHGTLDKFIGDGVLALFGAPTPVPAHAEEACEAALELVDQLRPVRERLEERGKPPTRTRIGLHTGPALVGNIGTPTRFQYTAIGGTVNLASRLQLLNKAYRTEIIASQATREAAGPALEWRMLDEVRTDEPGGLQLVHELIGRRGAVAAEVLRARDRYEWALGRLLAGEPDVAVRAFTELLQARPDDRAVAVTLARARGVLRGPGAGGEAGREITLSRADIDARS